VSSQRKTNRVVIARTIIDGSTSDMRESSGVSDGKLARRLTGKATSWACAEPVVPHGHAAYNEKLVWGWCNTTARGQRGWLARLEG
jgi:hypothetical protein